MRIAVLNGESFFGRTSYISADGGRAIAMVTVVNDDKSVAILHDVVVHESRRRMGIGSRLLAKAEEVAWHMGADVLKLAVASDPPFVKDWYARSGFKETGVSVRQGNTLTVMEKNITRSDAVEP